MALKECVITDVGETVFSRNSTKSALALDLEGSLKAIRDAGLSPWDIYRIISYSNAVVVAKHFVTGIEALPLRLLQRSEAVWYGRIRAALLAISAGFCNRILLPIGDNDLQP